MGKQIKILFIFNTAWEYSNPKIESLLEYIPNTSTQLFTEVLYTTEFSIVSKKLVSIKPDLVIYYGLGNGFLWENDLNVWEEDKLVTINSIIDNHTINELFNTEKYLYTDLFNKIKEKVLEIDLLKARPTAIKIASSKEELEYIKNRCFSEPFSFDTETNFLNPYIETPKPKLLCFSISWLSDEEEGWCIPSCDKFILSGNCDFSTEEALAVAEAIFFESPQPSFVHNAAFDLLILSELFKGKKVKNFLGDSMILLNLYYNASKSVALKNNTDIINMPPYKDPVKDWIYSRPKGSKRGITFEDVPLEIIAPYAAMDAIAVTRLINFLKTNMNKSLWKFYYLLPHKLINTANELCEEGYVISKDRYMYSKFQLEDEVKKAYNEVIALAKTKIEKEEFNINSSDHLRKLLFDKLKLPILSKTDKGSASTDQDALDDLILFHPIIFKLIKFKKTLKVYSSYSKGYKGSFNRGSFKYKLSDFWTINAQYKQINRTARLSSSNLSGHNEIKSRGGNVLVLPKTGSLVKHYFQPREVSILENELYDLILEKNNLKDHFVEKYNFNIIDYIKPKKAVGTVKKEKLIKFREKKQQKKKEENVPI